MGVSRLGRGGGGGGGGFLGGGGGGGGGGVVFQMGEASLGEHPMGSHWF